jgi:hypothetical protein
MIFQKATENFPWLLCFAKFFDRHAPVKTRLDRAGDSARLTQMLKNNSQVVILVVAVVGDAVGAC